MLDLLLAALLLAPQNPAPAPTAGSGSVRGVVMDENKKPLPDATVFALPESDMLYQIRTTSDGEGRFRFDGLPAGAVYLDAFKEDAAYPYNFFSFYKTNELTPLKVEVEGGKSTVGLVIQLGPRAARLNLVITDQNGAPVAGTVQVQLVFSRRDVPGIYKRGAGGKESVLVPAVPFRLVVEARGYKPSSPQSIHPAPGEDLSWVVRLGPPDPASNPK